MEEVLYPTQELERLPDEVIIELLKKHWGIDQKNAIEVWGQLEFVPNLNWAFLKKPRTLVSNKILTYPIVENRKTCSFFVSPNDASSFRDQKSPIFIKCRLELSPEIERDKHNIPCEMNVSRGSCVPLVELSENIPIDVMVGGGNSQYISKSIHDYFRNDAEIKIQTEFNAKRKALEDDLRITLESNEIELQQATGELGAAIKERDQIIKANQNLSKIEEGLNASVSSLTEEEKKKNKYVGELNKRILQMEEEMNQKIERLKGYVSEKAAFLQTFEFLDESDLDDFLHSSKSEYQSQEGTSFINQLNGDYSKAVSYVQAHLVNNNIVYPRHIIENFLTLLRTKDLIVLAGESGSGKTNLVESFARAVGGKSIIIPVKPNWTSSEDLLGYYNPLEKKYLATPFLDALLDAQKHPDIPYFICLDEMNLARVEYYFADFLSKLESRSSVPEISLYVEDESSHVLSELKAVVDIIETAKEKYNQNGVVDFVELLKDEELNVYLRQAFGFSDKDSLLKYHSEIRRMLSAVMKMPSSLKMPSNVFIIGTVNIDETTHYLSPKILDRAHVMRFDSPLLFDWGDITTEAEAFVDEFGNVSLPLLFEIENLGVRKNYPSVDPDNEFCKMFIDLHREFFHKLGIDFGMRSIRQGLHYVDLFEDVNEDYFLSINNFLLHKVLPKFTFDGNKTIGEQSKLELLEKVLLERLKNELPDHTNIPNEFSSINAIENIVVNAKANDGVVNFWS